MFQSIFRVFPFPASVGESVEGIGLEGKCLAVLRCDFDDAVELQDCLLGFVLRIEQIEYLVSEVRWFQGCDALLRINFLMGISAREITVCSPEVDAALSEFSCSFSGSIFGKPSVNSRIALTLESIIRSLVSFGGLVFLTPRQKADEAALIINHPRTLGFDPKGT